MIRFTDNCQHKIKLYSPVVLIWCDEHGNGFHIRVADNINTEYIAPWNAENIEALGNLLTIGDLPLL